MELKELSAKVDDYVALRDERLARQREVDAIKEKEDLLKAELIHELETQKVGSVGGSTHMVKLQVKDKPSAGDWAQVYEYIKRTNSFDLLQRRLNESAVEARWEEGEKIPGVSKFPVATLSISRIIS